MATKEGIQNFLARTVVGSYIVDGDTKLSITISNISKITEVNLDLTMNAVEELIDDGVLKFNRNIRVRDRKVRNYTKELLTYTEKRKINKKIANGSKLG